MPTWEEEKERFFKRLATRKNPKTIRNYRKHLKKFEEWWRREKGPLLPEPSEVDPDTFADFVIWLRQDYQPNYTNKIVSNVVRFLSFARNPYVFELREMIPSREIKPREYYTYRELQNLLYLFDERRGFRDFMLKVMVWCHALTGLRHFEVTNLVWEQINLHEGIITLKGKMGKWRKVYIPVQLRDFLRKYKEVWEAYMNWVRAMGFKPTNRLFFRIGKNGAPAEASDRYFYNVVSLRAKGVVMHFNWKKFRSTWAKALHDAKTPSEAAAILLGHSDIRTLIEYYHEYEVHDVSPYAEKTIKKIRKRWEREVEDR
jgi:integrase